MNIQFRNLEINKIILSASKKKCLITISLMGVLFSYQAFSQTLAGIISDAETGEKLPNVTVFSDGASSVAYSNAYGYYSINLKDCPCEVVFTSVGYAQIEKIFSTMEMGVFQNISLVPKTTDLNEVVVYAEVEEKHTQPIGLLNISVERLKKVPAVLGETDVLKALALTPGVVNAVEGTAGVLVRGGSPDQNLILLDETPVYNVNHLFGLLSVFNPDAVQDIKLYKAAFPARYGGRLSSVIDINSKEGSSKKANKEFSIGLINSRLLLEGPISGNNDKSLGTYLFAARLTNLTILTLPSYFSYLETGGQFFNYNLYDINAKWSKDFKDHSQVVFSLYNGHDMWYVKSNNGPEKERYRVNWGNLTASLRYLKPIGQKVFLKNTLAYTTYTYGLGSSQEGNKEETFIQSSSTLADFLLKSTIEYYIHSKIEIFLGGEFTAHTYRPVNISSSFNLEFPNNFGKIPAEEVAAFTEVNAWVTPWFKVNTGFRIASFFGRDTSSFSPEPRAAITLIPLKNFSMKLGYAKMGQFLHLLSSSTGGLQNDLWIPASSKLPFSTSSQWSLGVSKSFKNGWSLDLEGYTKNYTNLIEYQTGQNFIVNSEENYEDLIETNGIGETYGLEFMLDKSQGRFTGWLSYSLAYNNRRFENINSGNWFPANFDRRHVLNITGAYPISPKVQFSGNWVFQSGRPITVPIATHSNFITSSYPTTQPTFIFGDRNNFRTPNYHRLDINFNFNKETRRGNLRTLSIGAYNVYNNNNAFFLSTQVQFINPIINSNFLNRDGWDIRVKSNNFLPFLPYLNYSLKFK